MAKARKRNTVSGKAPKDKPRTKAEVAAAKRILAANKPKAKRSKGKKPKKAKKAKKLAKPSKFQRFLMKEGPGAMAKVPAWKHLK